MAALTKIPFLDDDGQQGPLQVPFLSAPAGDAQPTAPADPGTDTPEMLPAASAPALSPIGDDTPLGRFAQPILPPAPAAPQAETFAMHDRGERRAYDQGELQKLDAPHLGQEGSRMPGLGGKILHGLGVAGSIAGTVLAPGITAMIPGSTLNNQLRRTNLNRDLSEVNKEESADVSADAQAKEREALGNKADAIANADTPAALSPEEAQAIGHPEYAGMMITPRDKQKFFGNVLGNDRSAAVAAGHDATKVTTTGMRDDSAERREAAGNTSRETVAAAANKTRMLVAQMHDATSRANNENTVANRGKSGAGDGTFKVPADVTKRAALASNVLENSDAVDSLLKERPDIVGSAGGRYSNVQQMIGSDDPAIAELGVRMHNIALASNGAHGVRSAQAIESTEKELFNHFKSGPTAIHAALQGTRGSMQTFLDDEQNFGNTGRRTGNPAGGGSAGGGGKGGPKVGDVEGGYRFKGGDPASQNSWEKVGK